MRTSLRFIGKLVLIAVALLVLGALFVYSGMYNVGADTRHTKAVDRILAATMLRSVHAHARDIAVPNGLNLNDPAFAQRAVSGYEQMCRTCHGAPGKKAELGQFHPPPPDLADALRVKQWSDPEVFWIIKHGIKDTAMASFGGSHPGAHSDEDIWALTALIRQFLTMTPEQYQVMTERAESQPSMNHHAVGMEQKQGKQAAESASHKH